jgi:hypothetical protein
LPWTEGGEICLARVENVLDVLNATDGRSAVVNCKSTVDGKVRCAHNDFAPRAIS